MADHEGGERKIKVVDRRWFDESGELREDRPQQPPSGPREPAPSDAGDGKSEAVPSEISADPSREVPKATKTESQQTPRAGGVSWPASVNFLQMVDFLAQQALLLISGAQGIPPSPEQARIFIDFLGILEEKTRGNVTPEEARVLADILFQIRSLYVQQTAGT